MSLPLLDCLFPRHLPSERELLACVDPMRLEGSALRKRGIMALDRLVAATSYREECVRQMVHVFKYSRMRERGSDLAACLVPCLPFLSLAYSPILCPVPLHWVRRVYRGFNQAADLVKAIAQKTGLPARSLLRRVRLHPAQVGLSATLRRQNVREVFRCVDVPPAHIVLVDDVATTGATLDACARTLKNAGAERVEALVVALG